MLHALPPKTPPAMISQAPETVSLLEAERLVLQAFDLREGNTKLPVPNVQAKDRRTLRWLLASAEEAIPANPFAPGSAPYREAEAIRSLYALPADKRLARIPKLDLTLSGSHLALWNWGKHLSRRREFNKEQRIAWEDRLLVTNGPLLTRGYALRHALCFALAEADETRLSSLKAKTSSDLEDLLLSFQRAFALLGGPSPRLRLWKMPGLDPVEGLLSELGARSLWILPDSGKTPELPAGTTWIVPTMEGLLSDKATLLEGLSLKEGQALDERLKQEGRTAYLAPSRNAMEAYALCFFPILIRLDEKGLIQHILMGDAAPAKP